MYWLYQYLYVYNSKCMAVSVLRLSVIKKVDHSSKHGLYYYVGGICLGAFAFKKVDHSSMYWLDQNYVCISNYVWAVDHSGMFSISMYVGMYNCIYMAVSVLSLHYQKVDHSSKHGLHHNVVASVWVILHKNWTIAVRMGSIYLLSLCTKKVDHSSAYGQYILL